jgi:hypothetical protein
MQSAVWKQKMKLTQVSHLLKTFTYFTTGIMDKDMHRSLCEQLEIRK